MSASTPDAYTRADAAERYDCGRWLPRETMAVWVEAIRSSLPADPRVRTVLDLGCGTGRFSLALEELFGGSVIGVEPSAPMVGAAAASQGGTCCFVRGRAEAIPLAAESLDLVFMSQVFHHLSDVRVALGEMHRVLRSGGFLVIRNASFENNEVIPWLKFFPQALEIERRRIPPRDELARQVAAQGFELLVQRTVEQVFAKSPSEYLEKIRQRGLSSLSMIDDRAFEEGLVRFEKWTGTTPAGEPIHEPVDLFTFRRR